MKHGNTDTQSRQDDGKVQLPGIPVPHPQRCKTNPGVCHDMNRFPEDAGQKGEYRKVRNNTAGLYFGSPFFLKSSG